MSVEPKSDATTRAEIASLDRIRNVSVGYEITPNLVRCQKCGETMALRIIEPERPGFDSRTFECPKCFVTETLVVSIS